MGVLSIPSTRSLLIPAILACLDPIVCRTDDPQPHDPLDGQRVPDTPVGSICFLTRKSNPFLFSWSELKVLWACL